MSDVKSLAHTKWNCKYHIVFKNDRIGEQLGFIDKLDTFTGANNNTQVPDCTNMLGMWLVDKGYARIVKYPRLCQGLS